MLSVESMAEKRMGVSSSTLVAPDLRRATGGVRSRVSAAKKAPAASNTKAMTTPWILDGAFTLTRVGDLSGNLLLVISSPGRGPVSSQVEAEAAPTAAWLHMVGILLLPSPCGKALVCDTLM
jgi:hypothetical protein